MKTNEPMYYRILSQNDGMTITAETSRPMSLKEAKEAALEDVLSPTGTYQKFVVLPMCRTEDEWKYGHINFCPRCGKYIGNSPTIGEGVNNVMDFECPECESHVCVEIFSTPELQQERISAIKVKYCDKCKWNELQGSKGIPDGTTADELENCPDCGHELYEADGFDDIP